MAAEKTDVHMFTAAASTSLQHELLQRASLSTNAQLERPRMAAPSTAAFWITIPRTEEFYERGLTLGSGARTTCVDIDSSIRRQGHDVASMAS